MLLYFGTADDQIPWLGAGIGIVLGVIIVIADFLYTSKPTVNIFFYLLCGVSFKLCVLQHPMLMAITTISIAIFGYGIARVCRYYVKCQRDGMLQAPVDLCKWSNMFSFKDRKLFISKKSQLQIKYFNKFFYIYNLITFVNSFSFIRVSFVCDNYTLMYRMTLK